MMIKMLLKSLLVAGAQYAVAETLLRGDSAKRRLGHVLGGVILFIISGLLACFSVVFLLASFFFKLADMTGYVMPALVTGSIGLVIVVGLVFEGLRQMKK